MANISGPQKKKRRLLGTVVEAAAPVWTIAVSKTSKFRNIIPKFQRPIAPRVIRAYRTVSIDVASLLSELPPAANLLVLERIRIRARNMEPPLPGQDRISKSTIKNGRMEDNCKVME